MKKIFLSALFLLFVFNNASGYVSEEKLSVVIIGKIAKFVSWEDSNNEDFIITILDDPFDGLFSEVYDSKKIKNKNIKIKYIDNINDLEKTNILYISSSHFDKLEEIMQKVNNKNILTISDIRGFAQKGGIVQIYFASQKIKLKINIDILKDEKLKVKPSLLRIVEVIKEGK